MPVAFTMNHKSNDTAPLLSGSSSSAFDPINKSKENQNKGVVNPAIDAGLDAAKEIAESVESDADKTARWIDNARLAIDIARASLIEAEKLAASVQQTAETSTERVIVAELDSSNNDQAPLNDNEKANLILDATDIVDKNSLGPSEDVLSLQAGALKVQEVMEECCEQLLETRSILDTKAFKTMAKLKSKAEDIAVRVDETETSLRASDKSQERGDCPPTDAQEILKGDVVRVVTVDSSTMDKIDAVPPKSGLKKKPSKENEAPLVEAKELLRHEGVVVADPISLDIIDGLPKRDHATDIHPRIIDTNLTTIAVNAAREALNQSPSGV